MNEPIKEQLCWFWDSNLTGPGIYCMIFDHKDGNYFFSKNNLIWDYCQPLTKQELAEFMQLAPDGNQELRVKREGFLSDNEYAAETKQADEILEAKQQSSLPIIDWSKAPANAKAHVYNNNGVGLWLSREDVEPLANRYCWEVKSEPCFDPYIMYSDYTIFTSKIDWRTTLQVRPQEKEQKIEVGQIWQWKNTLPADWHMEDSEGKKFTIAEPWEDYYNKKHWKYWENEEDDMHFSPTKSMPVQDILNYAILLQSAPSQESHEPETELPVEPEKKPQQEETVKESSRGTYVINRPVTKETTEHLLDDPLADEVFDRRK